MTLRAVTTMAPPRCSRPRSAARPGPRPGGAVRRPVARRLARGEVGDVVAGPLGLVLVPPHQRLALAPRLALGVGGGAVVQDPPVGRPCPAPLLRDPVLLAGRLAP